MNTSVLLRPLTLALLLSVALAKCPRLNCNRPSFKGKAGNACSKTCMAKMKIPMCSAGWNHCVNKACGGRPADAALKCGAKYFNYCSNSCRIHTAAERGRTDGDYAGNSAINTSVGMFGHSMAGTTAQVFNFSKPGFTVRDALTFRDPEFAAYFIASFRAFSKKHSPGHIMFDWKTMSSATDLDSTNVEWALLAEPAIHFFAAAGGAENDCFGCLSGSANGVPVTCGRMIYPAVSDDKGKSGVTDFEGGMGGRCLNMRNFFIQSDDAEVRRFMQLVGKNAIDKMDKGHGPGTNGTINSKNKLHIYAFGGSKAWLHMRVEGEKWSEVAGQWMHPLYY